MSPSKSGDPGEPPIVVLLGLPFHDVTMDEALDECRQALVEGAPVYFVTANVDFAAQAYGNDRLRKILFYAKRVVCDGMPLIWISKVLGHPLRERIAGSDLTPKLLELCADMNKRVYFFGSDDQTLGEVVQILKSRMPELDIVGYDSPPMGKVQDWDNEAVVDRIRESGADLLLVALGCPKQEDWIYLFHERTGAALSIGIGASLDFVSGKQVRAPLWMQKTGMEWLWRMGTNPKRLLSRYTRDFLFLGWVTFKQWMSKRRRTTTPREPKAPGEAKSIDFARLNWSGSVERANLDQLSQPSNWSKPVLLDLQGVEFMDSGGMGALAGMARQARESQQRFGVLAPSEIVMKVLRSVRLDSLFEFYEDESEFVEQLRQTDATAGDAAVIHFQLGEFHDKSNVEDLQNSLQALIDAHPNAQRMVVDGSRVTFIDSSGVTALLIVRRQLLERGGGVELKDATPCMRRIIDLLRLNEFLPEYQERKANH